MKALVTGAGGFCWLHLRQLLESEGVQVFGLSARTERDPCLQIDGVRDEQGIATALEQIQPDYIFHFAGTVASSTPWEVFEVNVGFAQALISAARRTGLESVPILFAGSCAEYGDVKPEELPVSEDQACRPVTEYGISKFAQTRLAMLAARRGQRVVAVRSANLIGPGIPETLFLGTVIRQIARIVRGEQDPILELGNLDSARDFVDVRDAVRCYWQLVNQPAAFGQIVNVSSGAATPIRDLLRLAILSSGCEIQVRTRDERRKSHDLPGFYASNEKLRGLLGWAPVFDAQESLSKIMKSELGLP